MTDHLIWGPGAKEERTICHSQEVDDGVDGTIIIDKVEIGGKSNPSGGHICSIPWLWHKEDLS